MISGWRFPTFNRVFPHQQKWNCQKKKIKVILAIQAILSNPNLSARAAAEIYSVSHATLSWRLKGMASQRDIKPK